MGAQPLFTLLTLQLDTDYFHDPTVTISVCLPKRLMLFLYWNEASINVLKMFPLLSISPTLVLDFLMLLQMLFRLYNPSQGCIFKYLYRKLRFFYLLLPVSVPMKSSCINIERSKLNVLLHFSVMLNVLKSSIYILWSKDYFDEIPNV